jgi:hypothetical protein
MDAISDWAHKWLMPPEESELRLAADRDALASDHAAEEMLVTTGY